MAIKNHDPARARALSAGAVFHRCALQVNPHHYGGTFRGQVATGDVATHTRAIVDKALSLGISVLAVTDHNDVSGVPAFRAAAASHALHVFPGFELSSSEGVHVLCLYPPDAEQDQLGRYLGAFDITNTTPSTDLSSMSLVEILANVREQGGVTVAAHAASDQGGMLKVLKGQARVRAWRSEHLLAIQIPGPVADLPHDLRQIVENRNADYRRSDAPEEKLAIAAVNAKDIVKPADLEDRAARKVSRDLRDRVQIEVTVAGDREPLFKILRDDVGGRLAETIETLRGARDLSLTHFVAACRAGARKVVESFGGIPAKQAESLAQADEEVLMHIEELDLPPTTAIRLNTAPVGEPPSWQTLDELSTGQKATAVLLLLLLESPAPLIVDQPEDDLDNRFITEGVVPGMRAEKQRRQFVFSTHNANIPVLGDAELIVGLTASGEAERGHARIASEHVGSIDDRPVRELVEEILEGGKDAFERRRRKYGF